MSLTAYTGPMFSGKSTDLLSTCYKLSYRHGKQFKLFKFSKDKRYNSGDEVLTHAKISIMATPVASSTEMERIILAEDLKAIAIDEFQFFDSGIVDVVRRCIIKEINIHISVLNADKDQKIFDNYARVKPYITNEIVKLAYCDICGKERAVISHKHTIKYDSSGREIWIGGKEFYSAMCLNCYAKVKR